MMKQIYRILLSMLTGVLLWLSWPPAGFPFLSFIAFIPLFFVSDDVLKSKAKFQFWNGMKYAFIAFLIWNFATTWWILNITVAGGIATFILNALFMSIVFGFWQRFRALDLPAVASPLSFIAFWGSWEFLHLNWDITWPWLNLGNIFSSRTECVQWYEFTGAFGGCLWILLANFFIFYMLKNLKINRKKSIVHATLAVLWIALPIIGSLVLYNLYELPKPDARNSIEAVVVQQNTDPVEEQYNMTNLEHAQRILSVAESKVTPTTQLVVCAETAIPWPVKHDIVVSKDYPRFSSGEIPQTYDALHEIDTFVQMHPNLNLVIGLSTMQFYDHKATLTAHKLGGMAHFIDSYNTSVCYTQHDSKQTYFKSKLVPGVEKMPYPQVFGFLEDLAINLGGTSGSLGKDSVQRAFSLTGTDIKIGVPICYESAYGEHFGKFVKNGAQMMCVITNDGWWGNSPGHKQHFLLSKLRAVESRRAIMRSANTGISAFIDERGDTHQQTKYDTRLAIRQIICANDHITFYVQHGDYIARICVGLTALIFLFGIYWRIRKKSKKKVTA